MVIAALLFALTYPTGYRQREHVDVLELNHVLNEKDEVRFTQVILWRWTPAFPDSRHVVSEWFAIEEPNHLLYDRWQGYPRLTWRDRRGKVYVATSRTFKETYTRHDPEMADREVFPVGCRRPYFRDMR